MRRWLRVLVVVAVAAVPAVAGCGDDGDGTADVAATASTVAPTSAAPELDGAVPDACALVDAGEAEAVVGPGVEPAAEDGQSLDGFPFSECRWEADDGSLVAVAVVGSAERYRQHAERGLGEAVDDLGDEAVVATGVSLETKGATGGRTAVVRAGERTVVVAVKRQGETTVDEVVDLARAVVGRLG